MWKADKISNGVFSLTDNISKMSRTKKHLYRVECHEHGNQFIKAISQDEALKKHTEKFEHKHGYNLCCSTPISIGSLLDDYVWYTVIGITVIVEITLILTMWRLSL